MGKRSDGLEHVVAFLLGRLEVPANRSAILRAWLGARVWVGVRDSVRARASVAVVVVVIVVVVVGVRVL